MEQWLPSLEIDHVTQNIFNFHVQDIVIQD